MSKVKEPITEVNLKVAPQTIFFTFTMNGETIKTTTDNVLKSLNELSKSIVPTSIKTTSIFHYEFENKFFHRILRIGLMKMLLGSEMRRKMVAKAINSSLGLFGEDLYK